MRYKKIVSWSIFLLIAVGVLLYISESGSTDELRVTFFDVGQGDSILIETPSQQNILIDGGPGTIVLSKLGAALPFYDHQIDMIVLTHAHADHLNGLVEVLERYQVGLVLYSDVALSAPEYRAWEQVLVSNGIATEETAAGNVFTFGEILVEVLFPFADETVETDDLNRSSTVVKLTYQNTSFLLTGDAPEEVEKRLVERYGAGLRSNVLKVGHHGSKYSTSQEFLNLVQPELAIIQSGSGNSYGHPHRITLNRLAGSDARILRNDQMGDISLSSDGQDVIVQ